ncbi:MAG: hypothetical protein ACRELY_02115, partial [Polyangiaceae bacterium]
VTLSAGSGGARANESAALSFRADIVPVLTTSCSTRSCHGGMRAPLLGAHDGPAELRAALVNVRSEERTDLGYVTPGDPSHSYLIEKIEGRMTPAKCADHDCGDAMPLDNPALPDATRSLIRAWIEQGAKDN